MDTRKTTPLLRSVERYAVVCGGGVNHRFDLSSMAMIKDNHCMLMQDPVSAVDAIKRKSSVKVEVEVDTLDQFIAVLKSKADIILLDNMKPAQVMRAVKLRQQHRSKVLLEASGNVNIKNVRQYAAAGVDRISIGGLTHSREALDISLELCS